MTSATDVLAADWLGLCRGVADELGAILGARPTVDERVEETGEIGGGGDRTLVIDAAAEDAVFGRLGALRDAGHAFTAVSEERGIVDFGSDGVLVVIDPIDGSLNAKRGLSHHALSIAVADGPTMADVVFGYVYDFGPDEEWVARRGEGVLLDGAPLPAAPAERHDAKGRLELLAIESADPRWVAAAAAELQAVTHRLRALGSIAISLCQVAAARVDGMATLRPSRAVDAAAAQLIVREAGGLVDFTAFDDPLGAPLRSLHPISPVVAARTPEAITRLRRVPESVPDPS